MVCGVRSLRLVFLQVGDGVGSFESGSWLWNCGVVTKMAKCLRNVSALLQNLIFHCVQAYLARPAHAEQVCFLRHGGARSSRGQVDIRVAMRGQLEDAISKCSSRILKHKQNGLKQGQVSKLELTLSCGGLPKVNKPCNWLAAKTEPRRVDSAVAGASALSAERTSA